MTIFIQGALLIAVELQWLHTMNGRIFTNHSLSYYFYEPTYLTSVVPRVEVSDATNIGIFGNNFPFELVNNDALSSGNRIQCVIFFEDADKLRFDGFVYSKTEAMASISQN